jgi:hypothetical protein
MDTPCDRESIGRVRGFSVDAGLDEDYPAISRSVNGGLDRFSW